ncbi:MAG: leucine-rich repeat domain-containing protein [Chitinophagaceae bacterium]|nr:leucine-rich repeat domain-containing protein [Chitinophagaceae bacterium]
MKKIIVFLFPLLFLHFSVNAQVNIGDSLALVDLYNNTNGGRWETKTNWLNGEVKDWFGVRVSNNRVVQLSLINNNLDGTLPSSLGNLTAITGIFLSKNNLRGNIPVSICNLPSLEILDLSNNQIRGNIPDEIGGLTKLKELRLEHNTLNGKIPTSLRSIRSLLVLVLAFNQLTGSIPDEPGGRQIFQLELNNNQLTGSIPAALKNIHNLRVVRLNNNQLTGTIPSGLAPMICHLFDVSSNQLTGSIPNDLGSNPTLAHVNLSNNNLTGSIPDLGSMKGLQSLELDSNQLSGTIPASLKNAKRLVRLNLMNNQFSGTIPGDLCSLPDLQFLMLSNNQFTFSGMECIGRTDNTSMFANFQYKNQKTLTLNQNNSTISLNAGGSLANNTYFLYKDSVLVETIKGDSSFIVYDGGKYWVEVKNDDASKLTLFSTTVEMSTQVILPLQWLGFTAENCSGNVCLQWQTENEQNTSRFEIEKSTHGTRFTQIGNKAANNIPGKHTYNTIDNSPVTGTNFYRIKQVDRDGKFSYSDIVSIKIYNNGSLAIAPNPANDQISIRGINQSATVAIYNIAGRLLFQWQHVNANQPLNISSLQQGIYIIKIVQTSGETSHKLVKQ